MMKVILLENIRSLGDKYDVKDVADGYARNFLFPNKLAEPATPGTLKRLSKLKAKLGKEETELKKHLKEMARRTNETTLEFNLKTDIAGSVFGSVTKEEILRALREHGLVTKERVEIVLAHPLKTLGEHEIEIDFKKGIKANLKIKIRPE